MTGRIRALWEAGLCVCCGSDLADWEDFEPLAIGEGVLICGRCNAMEHTQRPGEEVLRDALLTGALGDDSAVADLLNKAGCFPLIPMLTDIRP